MEILTTVLILLAIIWYLGSSINNVLKGTGEVMSTEFDLLKDQQQVRIQKEYDSLGKQLEKLATEASYNKSSVKEMIKSMNASKDSK